MNGRIIRGAVAGTAYTIITILVGIVQLPIILAALPATIAGLWLLYLTIGSYASWFDLGMTPTVGREISFALGNPGVTEEERTRRITELMTTVWQVFRLLAAGIGVACFGVGEWVIRSSLEFGGNPDVHWAWFVFSIGVALNLASGASLAGLFGLGQVDAEKMIRSAAVLIGFVLTLTTLQLGWGIIGLALAWLAQSATLSALAWYWFRQRRPQPWPAPPQPDWSMARRLAVPSLKFAAIQLAAILILQSANPLIALMLGTASIPPYEAISKIASTLMTLGLLIATTSTPFFSMAHAAGDTAGLTLLLMRNLRFGVGLVAILCAFAAINGDRIVAIWLGSEIFPGFEVLWLLLGMVLLEVHHVIFATAVMAAGKIVFIRVAFASAALTIGLALILTERLGLLGIAVAVTTSQLLTNNWYIPFYAIRFFQLPVKELARRFWVPVFILLGVQITLNLLLRQMPWLGEAAAASLGGTFLVSSLLGVAFWWRLVLPVQDRYQIRNWLQHRWNHPLELA